MHGLRRNPRVRKIQVMETATVCEPGYVWIDLPDRRSLVATRPCEVVAANDPREVIAVLDYIDCATARGLLAVGYIAYEAAPAFDPAILVRSNPPEPLIWFGLYDQWSDRRDAPPPPGPTETVFVGRAVNGSAFSLAISTIHEYIRRGDVYQVNYTFREEHRLVGRPFDLFLRLRAAHPVPWSAYLHTGDFEIVSLSPELFLARYGKWIESCPMKGTAPRGRSWAEDESNRRALGLDPKNRAENVMIVDLMRNDLGRVCQVGSVCVPAMFEVTRYATVHQMTSTVRGQLRPGVGLVEILRATFPPGSVTGAPKIRATQVIAELENTPRGVYTGAIGAVLPGGDFTFNVAIRTLVCRTQGDECLARLGLGSGVVIDSDPRSEWEECLSKAAFLQARQWEPFELIETLRLNLPGGYVWLLDHLQRLRHSAQYFGFSFDLRAVSGALRSAMRDIVSGAWRVRLLVAPDGGVRCQRAPLLRTWPASGVRVGIYPQPVCASDPWLHHKTTKRALYERATADALAAGIDEYLFFNHRDELTEGAVTSVLVRMNGQWFAPAAACGLLPGVWRSRTLQALRARERTISLEELLGAEAVAIGNAVRGGAWVREILLCDGTTRMLPLPDLPPPGALSLESV